MSNPGLARRQRCGRPGLSPLRWADPDGASRSFGCLAAVAERL